MFQVITKTNYGWPPVREFDSEKKAIDAAKKICKESVLIDYCEVYSAGVWPVIVSQDHKTGRAKVHRMK
jgi:hypothetical protein